MSVDDICPMCEGLRWGVSRRCSCGWFKWCRDCGTRVEAQGLDQCAQCGCELEPEPLEGKERR